MSVASEIERLVGIKQDIKNAIIAKGQSVSDTDAFGTYAEKIGSIPTPADGSIPTKTASDLTASGATVTIPAGYYASQVTKDVATATQATPSISVDSSGKITASATQSAGYVSEGTKSATKQLTTQAAKTVTPGTSDQTAVASGVYTTGAVTVKGDENLVPENIAEGVSIFGVFGTHTGGATEAKKTVSVTVTVNYGASSAGYAFDADGAPIDIYLDNTSATYEILGGIIYTNIGPSVVASGDYTFIRKDSSNHVYCFHQDGGSFTINVSGGAGD